jgi:hypothetical protein
MTKKSRTHLVTIRVSFDRACSRQTAVRLAREELRGQDFYTNAREDREPEKMVVRSIMAAAPKAAR